MVACAPIRARAVPGPPPIPIAVGTKDDVAPVHEVVRSKVDRVNGVVIVVVVVVVVFAFVVVVVIVAVIVCVIVIVIVAVIEIVDVDVAADDILDIDVNTHTKAIKVEIGTKISYVPAGVCVSLAGNSRRIFAYSLVPVTIVVTASLAVVVAIAVPFVMVVLEWSSGIR